MRIIYPLGDWGYMRLVKSKKKITYPKWDKISPIGDLKYPIGDTIPNWVLSSDSPLTLRGNFILTKIIFLLTLSISRDVFPLQEKLSGNSYTGQVSLTIVSSD